MLKQLALLLGIIFTVAWLVMPASAQPEAVNRAFQKNIENLQGRIERHLPTGFTSLPTIIAAIFTTTIAAAGGIFVIMLLFGGVEYLLGAGNEETTKRAKGRMIDATIGLVVTLSAWAIGTFVLRQFYGAGTTGGTGSSGSRGAVNRLAVTASITDQNGLPVAGALISINGNPKGRTGADGTASFTLDQGPRTYRLTIEAPGCNRVDASTIYISGNLSWPMTCLPEQ